MDTFGNILLKDGVSPKNRENSEKFQTWATFQYTKLDSDTHVIANVVCKIQGFEFLQNIQNCEVINDNISNDLYYIFIIYKVTKKAHLIHLKCAIHATYCLLTDYVGSFTEKETSGFTLFFGTTLSRQYINRGLKINSHFFNFWWIFDCYTILESWKMWLLKYDPYKQ